MLYSTSSPLRSFSQSITYCIRGQQFQLFPLHRGSRLSEETVKQSLKAIKFFADLLRKEKKNDVVCISSSFNHISWNYYVKFKFVSKMKSVAVCSFDNFLLQFYNTANVTNMQDNGVQRKKIEIEQSLQAFKLILSINFSVCQ